MEQINSTPSWQRNNLTPGENFNAAKAYLEGDFLIFMMKKIYFVYIASNEQSRSNPVSNENSPQVLIGSGEKNQPSRMPTINEDLYESQCTTTINKNNANEDLKEVTDLKYSGNQLSDISDLSNIKENTKSFQNSDPLRGSYTKKYKNTPVKTIDPFNVKSKNKKPLRRDYSKLIQELQTS